MESHDPLRNYSCANFSRRNKLTSSSCSDVLSQAIVSNNTVYCSGAVGIDPSTKTLVSGTVTDRTVPQMPLSTSLSDPANHPSTNAFAT